MFLLRSSINLGIHLWKKSVEGLSDAFSAISRKGDKYSGVIVFSHTTQAVCRKSFSRAGKFADLMFTVKCGPCVETEARVDGNSFLHFVLLLELIYELKICMK